MALEAFGRFVPRAVVNRIVSGDKRAAELYVFDVDVTIMFTDIADFTAISESLPVTKVIVLLEGYLGGMSHIVESSGGTIGDFIGDGIMAFWNSPNIILDHQKKAVQAMLLQQEKLAALNAVWVDCGLMPMWPRYGIHSGHVLSGNIGYREKMKFGVVGDTVNLASRLEGLNKHFGCVNLISQVVFDQIKDEYLCWPYGRVAVKGREQSLAVYEVVGRLDSAPDSYLIVREHFQSCMQLMSQHKFKEALTHMAAVQQLLPAKAHPNGQPNGVQQAAYFMHRLQELIAAPDPNWDGITRFNAK
eukprot:jgi/Mesvir1/19014/Mv12782-RA.1